MPLPNRTLPRLSAVASAWILCVSVFPGPTTQAAQTVKLQAPAAAQPTRVKVALEVDGQLFSQPTKSDVEENSHELKAKGQFLYEERFDRQLAESAVRYYEQAEAEISIDGRPGLTKLRDDRRFIEVGTNADVVTFRSLQGALSRQELELIEVPAGSQLADRLLPGREVQLGESWPHDDQLLARLLNLSAVTANEVTSKLTAIDTTQQVARIVLRGKLLGSVAGVMTEIQLEGKYSYDLRRHRISWLALGIQEQREAGLTKPGLKVHARVRVLIEERLPEHLSPEAVRALAADAPQTSDLLEYQPPHGRFTLMHDRRWHVFSVRPELVVMRLVDDGQLIAQCNLHTVPVQGGAAPISLGQFQNEIRTALGSAAQQIVDSTESVQPNGVRQLRVCIVGKVAEAPVQWIYYQLTDADRQSLTCVFTMSGEDIDQFGSEDLALVSSIAFHPPTGEPRDEAKDAKDVARRPVTGAQ